MAPSFPRGSGVVNKWSIGASIDEARSVTEGAVTRGVRSSRGLASDVRSASGSARVRNCELLRMHMCQEPWRAIEESAVRPLGVGML